MIQADIKTKILDFHRQLEADANHRYLSWDHCYRYFRKRDVDHDIASLHLAFYLASWGMYRGSSFLLWKDYRIHKVVVRHLLKKRHLARINFALCSDSKIEEMHQLCADIRELYRDNAGQINGTKKKINVSDTLATKIVLGTLGCLPAYDRFFIAGLRASGIRPMCPSLNGIRAIIDFYVLHQKEFDELGNQIKIKGSVSYPPMKLLDMYFWKVGYEAKLKASKDKKH